MDYKKYVKIQQIFLIYEKKLICILTKYGSCGNIRT